MLAKLTTKNQLTLPKRAIDALGRPSHFDVRVEDGRLILAPMRMNAAEAVRDKLEAMGLGPDDVVAAVAWARSSPAD